MTLKTEVQTSVKLTIFFDYYTQLNSYHLSFYICVRKLFTIPVLSQVTQEADSKIEISVYEVY